MSEHLWLYLRSVTGCLNLGFSITGQRGHPQTKVVSKELHLSSLASSPWLPFSKNMKEHSRDPRLISRKWNLLTVLLSKIFWERYSLWTSSKENLPLKIHHFYFCFFVTFFRHIWESIFFKGEFRNISRERYSLGPVEIGAWCRPPALFAAMFSELATKETIFQPWLLPAARP